MISCYQRNISNTSSAEIAQTQLVNNDSPTAKFIVNAQTVVFENGKPNGAAGTSSVKESNATAVTSV